jgi:gamma-glutamyltranspeptidase/glutathione hydrolase
MGTSAAVSTGHPLSTLAATLVLQQGGNAVDAAVAAALAGCVLQSDMVSFAGIACIQMHDPASGETLSIAGVGHWPARASLEELRATVGRVPTDLRNGVVPGAPDAYLTALERSGTWTFARVAAHAIELAREGFPMYPFRFVHEREHAAFIERTPSTREVYWPNGRPVRVGELFRQPDLARSLASLAAAEAGSPDRLQGLNAVREAFYTGEIATRIDAFFSENGGYLRKEDLHGYRAETTSSITGTFGDFEISVCPFWSKGPMLLEILNMLAEDDTRSLGHNSTAYIHLLTEALKLAFADRHAYYGDPRFVDVPAEGLLSPEYGRARRTLIRPAEAWREMPPPGDPWRAGARAEGPATMPAAVTTASQASDTSNLSVVDRNGMACSITFSDPLNYSPIMPGTGLLVSNRGMQAWADPEHPNRVRPGQRPLVTGNPVLVFERGSRKLRMALGSPGADVQVQAILQVLFNVVLFGMDCQQAVEAPRFATYSHPNSFEPHGYEPGVLRLESTVPAEVRKELEDLGHAVDVWPPYDWRAGGIAVVAMDDDGMRSAGADPRRENYALAW